MHRKCPQVLGVDLNPSEEAGPPGPKTHAAFPRDAAEIVRLKVDVILTQNTPIVLAAKQVTSVIPIVFATADDPVGSAPGDRRLTRQCSRALVHRLEERRGGVMLPRRAVTRTKCCDS
jgi:hypothetical protein